MMFISRISLKDSFKKGNIEDYPFYLRNIRALCDCPLDIKSEVVFFVGENGSGKTTLIETLASIMGSNKYGGSRNFIKNKLETPELEKFLLVGRKNVSKDVFFFRAETFFNLQKELDEYSQASSKLYMQYTNSSRNFREFSHGQGFKRFFANRIRPEGLYFFDEPEAALSPESQIELLFMIKEFKLMGAQLIIATHSPILLSYPGSQIFSFDGESIEEIHYENTGSFKLTKGFLENYRRYQKEILEDGDL